MSVRDHLTGTPDVLWLRNCLGTAEDIDRSSTITELYLQNLAYQAALNTIAKTLQPSLLDFLQ